MMIWTGSQHAVQQAQPVSFLGALEYADVGSSIVTGALGGLALLLCVCVKRFSWRSFVHESLCGMRLMMPAICILCFAWTIGVVVNHLGTGEYLATLTKQHIATAWLPFLLFVLAGVMAFATGTSFATFGMMLPLGCRYCDCDGHAVVVTGDGCCSLRGCVW